MDTTDCAMQIKIIGEKYIAFHLFLWEPTAVQLFAKDYFVHIQLQKFLMIM